MARQLLSWRNGSVVGVLRLRNSCLDGVPTAQRPQSARLSMYLTRQHQLYRPRLQWIARLVHGSWHSWWRCMCVGGPGESRNSDISLGTHTTLRLSIHIPLYLSRYTHTTLPLSVHTPLYISHYTQKIENVENRKYRKSKMSKIENAENRKC